MQKSIARYFDETVTGWLVLAACLAALLLAGCGGGGGGGGSRPDPTEVGGDGEVPRNAVYRVQIEGQGGFSGLPSGVPFRVEVDLVAQPVEEPDEDDVAMNDFNPIEVGIFTTSANPIVGQAGALYFGTNTSLSERVGMPAARLGTFNVYNLTGGLTAQVHHVLSGGLRLRFTEGRERVEGEIILGGSSGSLGPAVTSEYRARLQGERVD